MRIIALLSILLGTALITLIARDVLFIFGVLALVFGSSALLRGR